MKHSEYLYEAFLEFYMRWAYAEWYEWVAQIIYLTSLVALFYYNAMFLSEWMETAEVSALNELIFFGSIFGFIGFLFLWRAIYGTIVVYLFSLFDK